MINNIQHIEMHMVMWQCIPSASFSVYPPLSIKWRAFLNLKLKNCKVARVSLLVTRLRRTYSYYGNPAAILWYLLFSEYCICSKKTPRCINDKNAQRVSMRDLLRSQSGCSRLAYGSSLTLWLWLRPLRQSCGAERRAFQHLRSGIGYLFRRYVKVWILYNGCPDVPEGRAKHLVPTNSQDQI